MQKTLLILAGVLACGAVMSQTGQGARGTIKIYQDQRITSLVARHIQNNAARQGMNGYRIQIYFGSGKTGREQANESKAKALEEFPELQAHILYQYSNYKVRVGDFRTRNDAYQWYYEVLKKFPNAYIVPDVILYPKLN
jgi:hypothetical protein